MSQTRPPTDSPIAVVGLDVLLPGTPFRAGFWRDILAGRDCISDVPASHWLIEDYYDEDPSATDKTYCRRGGFLDPVKFDPLAFGIPPAALSSTDTAQLLALVLARKVLDQANDATAGEIDRSRTSIILGVASATELVVHLGGRLQRPNWIEGMRREGLPESQVQRIAERIADTYTGWTEASFPGLLGNVVAGRIANRLDLGGTNFVTDAACASSLSAVQAGINELRLGEADTVIAGGVDALNDILMYMCFSKTPAFSPSGDCRPFSDKADGTILGEGLAMLALRRLEDAERDGNHIHAVIRGIGSASDGQATSVYAPKPEGQAQALRRAYAKAGYSPATVELMEAHGTGTVAGDAAEFAGLKSVFGPEGKGRRSWCALGSIKSQIGHTKSAAGAAGLFKAVMALSQKALPPTAKVDRPNPKLGIGESPFYINTKARPWIRGNSHPRRASVSSFGFGGSNFHLTIEEYTGAEGRPMRVRTMPTELYLLSAGDRLALASAAGKAAAVIKGDNQADLGRITASAASSFDPKAGARLAIVATSVADLVSRLEIFAASPDKPQPHLHVAEGTPDAGGIAFLFPGQGSQYVGMGADLALSFEDARAVWDEAAGLDEFADAGLHDLAFPPSAFDTEETKAQQERLTAMANAQPAIGAVSAAQLAVLSRLGLRADAVAGHSYGEVTALYAAGLFDRTAMLRIARARGHLMTEAAGEMKGGMIALPLSREEAAEMLEKSGADLVIANDNGPKQVVLSGAAGEVEKALNWFAGEGVNAVRLPVANAFHSGIVADAVAPFRSVLDDLDLAEARIPVIAGTTGATYGEGADDIRAVLGGQIAAPISFRKQVETLYASGVRRFVEVGPASVLTGLVRQCLDGREHLAVSLDRKGENGVTAFLEGIAALAVSGVDMDYAWLWQEAAPDPEPVAAPKHAVDIRGSNYGKPYPPENGAAGRHAPNPEKPVEPVAQTAPAPAAAPQAPSPQPLTPGASADFQRQLAETHLAFQQSMADSHRAFLETMERLAWGQPSAMPATASVPAAMPAPAAAVAQTMAPPQSMAPPQPAQSVSAPSPVQPAPTVPAAQKPAPSKSGSADPAAVVIGLVAEKTGYPADMLSLDMDLEADLGIDSIKQVEILSSLRDALPGLAEPDPGMLSEMATLRKIVEFVGEAASGSEASGTPEAESSAGPDSSLLIAVVAEKTGYPADMLSLDMELEGDLGIDSIKQVEILSSIREQFPDMPEIDPGQLSELKTLGAIVDFLGVQEAPVAVATSPAASVAASPVSSTGPDSAALLAVVAAKTGYPADMLSLDMELEGDLGIDSIKQVEILSSVREQFPDMPEIDPGQLSELRTIGAILAQLGGAVVAPVAEAATVASSEIGFDSAVLLEVVADKTGYPADMLSLEMELEGDLGIDSIKQVEILSSLRDRYPSMPEADPSLLSELRTLGAILDWLDGDAAEEPVATTDEPVRPAREVARWVVRPTPAPVPAGSGVSLPANAKLVIMPSRAPIASALAEAFSRHGVEAVLSDEADADAFGLVLIAGDEGDAADHVISSVMAASAMAPRLKQSGGLFVTVEDLGGDFGLGGCVSDRAWRSGLAGLAGTARQEWPHASVKAIDIDLSRRDEADAAEALVQEILRGGPEGEVALSVSEGRRVPVSTAAPLIPLTGRSGLRGGMVIVASAGARGITAASLIEFARHHKLKLALLGRTAYQPESDDSLRDAKDEPALIKALAGRGGRSGDPSMLRARARAILQSREITETIDRLTELGSEVKYLTADIRDAGQVTECVARVRADWGPVTGIVHGAGVLADRRLEDKTAEQVRAVAVTKLDGLANMLAAVADDPLEMICLFSSAAGVAGNVGQSDYAMVNRVMDNVASSLQAERPDCVVKSVAWGPWEGGMVDAGLAALFKARGIDLIPLDAGTAFLRHELEAGGSDCRVIAGSADLGGATGKPAGSGGEGEAQAAAGD